MDAQIQELWTLVSQGNTEVIVGSILNLLAQRTQEAAHRYGLVAGILYAEEWATLHMTETERMLRQGAQQRFAALQTIGIPDLDTREEAFTQGFVEGYQRYQAVLEKKTS